VIWQKKKLYGFIFLWGILWFFAYYYVVVNYDYQHLFMWFLLKYSLVFTTSPIFYFRVNSVLSPVL